VEKSRLPQDLMTETKEYDCFNFLYGDLVLEDFAIMGKENCLNKDYEDHIFNDLSYFEVYDILNDSSIFDFEKQNKKISFLNLASNSGKLTIFSSIFHKFEKHVGVENFFELHELSNYIFGKLKNSDYNILSKTTNISFINEGLLDAKLDGFNLLVIDYNNSNFNFNRMLENKINAEVKKGSLIIKIIEPFEKNKKVNLLKTKILNRKDGENIFVYYYTMT
jgi:uncharacterized protein with NRDE domain